MRTFTLAEGGDVWLSVPGLLPRTSVAVPLNTTAAPAGTLRVILRGGRAEVHYQVDGAALKSSTRPRGDRTIGADKGYTEVLTDSDGVHHGPELGRLLSGESDRLKAKNRRRAKIRAVAERAAAQGGQAKADRIARCNLGTVKKARARRRFEGRARTVTFSAMSLFHRAHEIVQAKANKALDAAEKPDEMLDLSYEQMLDQITQVRRSLVAIAASRKQIELQEQQLQHSVAHLDDQARAALSQGREDLAREALSRKAAAQAQIDGMEPQHQQLTEQEASLERTLAALQSKVNNFRTQKEVLKAQYTAASAMSSVDESVAGISSTIGDSGAEVQRAQDKIATMQARAGALDELLQSGVLEDVGGDTDDIQKELDEAGSAAEVDKELAALKTQIGPGGSAPPELTAG